MWQHIINEGRDVTGLYTVHVERVKNILKELDEFDDFLLPHWYGKYILANYQIFSMK